MDIANAGMGKVKDMLKKVAIGETVRNCNYFGIKGMFANLIFFP